MKLTGFTLLPWRFRQHVSPKRWYFQLKYRMSHPEDHNVIFTTARFSDISILFRCLEDTITGGTACVIFRVVVRLTDWLTDWLTDFMEWSHSWEATGSSVSQEIYYTLWNTEVYYRVYKRVPLVIIMSQINPIHAHTAYFIHTRFNIIPSMPRSSNWSLSFTFPRQCSQNMSRTRVKWHRCSDVLGFLSLWQ
jgi:hypothetical protein